MPLPPQNLNDVKRKSLKEIAIETMDLILFSEKTFKSNFHRATLDYKSEGNQMMLIAKTKWVLHRMTQLDEILCGYAAVDAFDYFLKNKSKKLYFGVRNDD